MYNTRSHPRLRGLVPATSGEQQVLPMVSSDGFAALLDAELVAQALGGNREGLTELCARHHAWVYRYLLTHVGDADEAQDVLQEAFLKLVDGLSGFRNEGSFKAWLFRVVQHTLTDYVRTRQRRVRLEQAQSDQLLAQPHEDDIVEQDVLLSEVAGMIQELPLGQRDVASLRFGAGLSVGETAVILGKPEGTIKALQFQAVHALRRRMGL